MPQAGYRLQRTAGPNQHPRNLSSIQAVNRHIKAGAMIWVVYPKGVKQITQTQVIFAGNMGGYTDCKVCRFSKTRTALKFGQRRANRS